MTSKMSDTRVSLSSWNADSKDSSGVVSDGTDSTFSVFLFRLLDSQALTKSGNCIKKFLSILSGF